MTACDRCAILLSRQLDGDLTTEEERELSAHLAVCPDCRALAEELTGMTDVLRDLPEVEPPEELKERILQAVREEQRVLPAELSSAACGRSRRSMWRRAAAMAAAVVVLVGAATVWRMGLGDVTSNQASGASQPETVQNTGERNLPEQEGTPMESIAPAETQQPEPAEASETNQPAPAESAPGEGKSTGNQIETGPAVQFYGSAPAGESAVTAMLLCYDISALPEVPDYLLAEEDGAWLCPAERFADFRAMLEQHQVTVALETYPGYTGVAGEWVRVVLAP